MVALTLVDRYSRGKKYKDSYNISPKTKPWSKILNFKRKKKHMGSIQYENHQP